MDDFDAAYGSSGGDYFGDDPEPLLVRNASRLPPSLPVLDLGAGQGRNALYLAGEGFEVDAIDTSQVAVETLRERVEGGGLPIRVLQLGFGEHEAEPGSYGGVLAFGLIQLLRWDGVERLVNRIRGWATAGGLIFVSAFTTDDEGWRRPREGWRQVDRSSFVREDGAVRTYLQPGELRSVFDGFHVVHLHEGLGPVHRHGDGPPERHAIAEAVFQAPGP